MSTHRWGFENGRIEKKLLEDITDDFKKVLPFIQNEMELTGIQFHELWTSFNYPEAICREFFFGIYNDGMNMENDTYDLPHDKAVVAFLTIAKKHLGHTVHVESTAPDAKWRDGISLCQNVLGHDYDLMDITKNGKLRFKTWEVATYGK